MWTLKAKQEALGTLSLPNYWPWTISSFVFAVSHSILNSELWSEQCRPGLRRHPWELQNCLEGTAWGRFEQPRTFSLLTLNNPELGRNHPQPWMPVQRQSPSAAQSRKQSTGEEERRPTPTRTDRKTGSYQSCWQHTAITPNSPRCLMCNNWRINRYSPQCNIKHLQLSLAVCLSFYHFSVEEYC